MTRQADRRGYGAGRRSGGEGRSTRSATSSGANLPGAEDQGAVGGELLQTDRPTRVNSAGGNADLGAEAELASIAELGRGIPQCYRAVDTAQELPGGGFVLGDNGVGVLAAV